MAEISHEEMVEAAEDVARMWGFRVEGDPSPLCPHCKEPEVYVPPDSWPSWEDFEYPLTPEDLEGLLAEGGLETWALHTVMQHNAVQRREATNLIRWNTALAALAGIVVGLLLA